MQDQHSNSIGHEEDLQLFPPCFQTNGCPLNDIEDLGGQFFNDSRGSSSSSTFDMLFGNHLYTAAEMFHTLQLNDGLTFADSQVFRHEGSGSIAHGQQQHLITPSSSPPRSCPPPPPCSLIPESNVTSLPSVSSSSSSKRKKVGKACESCRRAKVGCGEERPCQRCVKKNIACIDKLPQQLYHLDAHHPYVPIMLDRSAFAPSAEIILNGDNNQNQNHQKRQRLCVPTKCSSCPVKIRPAVSQSSSSRVFNSLTTETHQGVILLSPGIMDADIHQTVLQLTSTKSTSLVGLPPSTAFQVSMPDTIRRIVNQSLLSTSNLLLHPVLSFTMFLTR